MTDAEIDGLAEKLYEYGQLHQELQPADAIIALGNMDIRIAERAAALYHQALAPIVVASGGVGRLTPKEWNMTEAAIFAEELYRHDVPVDKVIVEDKSTNLPENIQCSLESLEKAGSASKQLLLVTLPFAERRIMALCQKQFSKIGIQITSASIPYALFANAVIQREEMINLIVGELDRLEKFPAKGFSVAEEIPQDILDAVITLLRAGFDKYRVT